jgi:primary-amine oxidase
LLFNTITLYEPPKTAVLKWGGVVSVKQLSDPIPELRRQAEVHHEPFFGLIDDLERNPLTASTKVFLLCPLTRQSFEALVDLPSNLANATCPIRPFVTRWSHVENSEQLSLQVEELLWAEVICRRHPKIQAIARKVGVEPENLFCDGTSGQQYKPGNNLHNIIYA